MAQNSGPSGPATLVKAGANWLDAKVVFSTPDKHLAEAAMMVWQITKRLRAVQGERRLSNFNLSLMARVRRQTVSDVLMGVVWPDTKTLLKLCSALDLELTLINKE